jgi:hypothetical protein
MVLCCVLLETSNGLARIVELFLLKIKFALKLAKGFVQGIPVFLLSSLSLNNLALIVSN